MSRYVRQLKIRTSIPKRLRQDLVAKADRARLVDQEARRIERRRRRGQGGPQ